MKKIILLFLLIFIPFCTILSQANCDRNKEIAKKYLEKRVDIRSELLDEIKNSLDSCQSKDGLSYYIKGLIEMRKKPLPNYETAFENFSKASEYNHTRAKTYLGYFYKNGWATQIDYSKSLYWIQQAADEGDDNALYTLGYYHLKGLAGLEPDYEKAVIYFEQSNHKMAKHWLAFCKYFGFGADKDETGAETMLEDIETPNSEELLSYLEDLQSNSLNFEEFSSTEQATQTNLFHTNESKDLYGLWLEKDWKNQKIIRKLPVIIKTGNNDPKNFILEIKDETQSVKLNEQGKLLSRNLSVKLPSPFSNAENTELNTYEIKDISMTEDNEEGIYDIECSAWMKEYKEKGPPITIRVYSDKALAKRIDKTFKVYPTIFTNVLNFEFTIEHESEITFSLFDLGGNLSKTFDFGEKPVGKQQLEFDGTGLNTRSYIAVLTVNDLRFARQVIKVN